MIAALDLGLDWLMAYQRPFRREVTRDGLLAVAPVSALFVLLTLVVSGLWREGTTHAAVAACCAWRATDLPRRVLLPLAGSAFLVRRPVEAAWTVAAGWLLLGPLEAAVGGHRLLAIGAFGHAVPTVLVDLAWLAGPRAGEGLAGLDVGTSAVVVAAATALASWSRSAPLAAVLAAGVAVDLATTPNLASAEHLVAVAVGAAAVLDPGTLRPAAWTRRAQVRRAQVRRATPAPILTWRR
ncbi:MAG TPA: hypothetical protein VFD04_16895 [Actinomycetes bacterium]|nr:hypothetical protein [Actinomycetes bacterium]